MNGREVRLKIDVHHYNNFEELSVALEMTLKERNWGSETLFPFFGVAWPKKLPLCALEQRVILNRGWNFLHQSLVCGVWRAACGDDGSRKIDSNHCRPLMAPPTTQIDVKNCARHTMCLCFSSRSHALPQICVVECGRDDWAEGVGWAEGGSSSLIDDSV